MKKCNSHIYYFTLESFSFLEEVPKGFSPPFRFNSVRPAYGLLRIHSVPDRGWYEIATEFKSQSMQKQ